MSPELTAGTPTKSGHNAGGGGGGNTDKNQIIGSLGDALAGVSLGGAPNGHQAGFSFNNEHSSGTPFNNNGDFGWGYTNGDTPRKSFPGNGQGGQGAVQQPKQEPATPQKSSSHERNESIDLLLSQSASQALGNDVFKVSTNDLPGLALSGGAHPLGNGNISASPGSFDMGRRKAESPQSGMGTTSSSRSGSPHEKPPIVQQHGTANGEGNRNTIQAYHGYDGAAPAPGMVAAQGVDESSNQRLQSPYRKQVGGGDFSGFGSPTANPSTPQSKQPQPQQQHQQQVPPPQQQPQPQPQPQQPIPQQSVPQPQQQPIPNVNAQQPVNPHHQQQVAQQQQQQPVPQQQILYMAVPTPDGRQVLQPVQMVQLPGKSFAYVLPGQGGMPVMPQPGMQDPHQPPHPMMMMPQMQMQPVPPPPPPPPPPPLGAQQQNGGGLMNGMAPNPVQNKPMGGYGGGDPSNPGGQYGVDTNLRGDYDNSGQGGAMVGGQYMPAPAGGGDAQPNGQSNDPISSLYSTPQRPPLDALLGQVRRLSRDQVGCRLVQQALDEEGAIAATLILNEGLPFWGEAMVDPFGNYLFQKILEKITAEERVMLVKSVSTRLVNASLNLHGTRSVQKIVELCALDEEKGFEPKEGEAAADLLTKALAPSAARLCIDSHGNHVIQRILLKLDHKHAKFVFDAVAESVGDVARHRHGCCVIQRCLDSPPSEARSHLVCRIVDKSLELMQDAYGNYVVQYVLDVCSDEDVHAVCESVVGKVNLLAIQKFSSNVMEKCLERCTDRVKEHYMSELSESERIRELMMDPFGNYVVQRALSVSTHAQAVRLVEAMRPHLLASNPGTPNAQRNGGVRNTAGGRRIMAKICRRFPNFTLTPTGTNEELYSQNKGHHRHQQQPQHHNHAAMMGQPYAQQIQMAMAPSPLHPHHHPQHHPQQHFGATPHHVNLGAPHQPYEQHPHQHQPYPDQRQPYYDMGDATGYYQHTPHPMGHGAYPSL